MAESSAYKMEARSLGPGNLQASPGDHTHDGVTSKALGSWTSYTPAWTSSSTQPVLNNGTLDGAYLVIANTVDFRIVLTYGTGTTFGSGQYNLTLPVAPAAVFPLRSSALGTGGFWDASASAFRAHHVSIDSSGGLGFKLISATGSVWSSSIPFVPAAFDSLVVIGRYEID
ncbi:MAG TPA: hypothetical protein V6C65_08025 [Allocoleopsis sp.]